MQTKTRAIRISDKTWNELEQRANQHSLRGRAEYITYMLDNPAVTTQEVERIVERVVEIPDPATQRQLDAANAKITELNSLIRSATELRPPRGLKEIIADMPEKTRAKWDAEKWKAETWVKYFLEHK